MTSRQRQFENGGIYHITSRRIGNNLLFRDENDYYRGIFSIYEFNNKNPVSIRQRREERARFKTDPRGRGTEEDDKRDKLVEVLAFCLMPNHLHLLLQQIEDNGISRFMQKVGGGYARYLRDRYQEEGQRGYVFQNRFVSVPIETDEHLQIIFTYIHTNPIALIEPKWKELGVTNREEAAEFVTKYKWSSYQDYLDQANFPSVTTRDFILKIMAGPEGCQESIDAWIANKEELKKMLSNLKKAKLIPTPEVGSFPRPLGSGI